MILFELPKAADSLEGKRKGSKICLSHTPLTPFEPSWPEPYNLLMAWLEVSTVTAALVSHLCAYHSSSFISIDAITAGLFCVFIC